MTKKPTKQAPKQQVSDNPGLSRRAPVGIIDPYNLEENFAPVEFEQSPWGEMTPVHPKHGKHNPPKPKP
jgi:hypothetical protein